MPPTTPPPVPVFSNQETEDLVRWLIVNLTGAGLQELLRQAPVVDLDTPTEDLSQKLRNIFLQILPPKLQKDWLAKVNWLEVAAYLMEIEDSSS